MVNECSVRFLPEEKTVKVKSGTDLASAAILAGIDIRSGCGGEGTCGRCAVIVREGAVFKGEGNLSPRLKKLGCVLACRTWVRGDVVVEVLPESRLGLGAHVIDGIASAEDAKTQDRFPIDPITQSSSLNIDKPSLESGSPDATRLKRSLGQLKTGPGCDVDIDIETLRGLPLVLSASYCLYEYIA
jgi:ferredoxin